MARGKRKMVWLICAVVALAVVVAILVLRGTLDRTKTFTVGEDIRTEEITDFYFTWSTSTFPPEYQRYRFYLEDGKCYFYHETREGDTFPLTEADITVNGVLELSDSDWDAFLDFVMQGAVTEREDSADSGGRGPWLYLYWNGDRGKYQEFAFRVAETLEAFEEFCLSLREAQMSRAV